MQVIGSDSLKVKASIWVLRCLVGCLFSVTAFANTGDYFANDDDYFDGDFLINLGLTYGGDKVAYGEYVNPETGTKVDDATLYGGALYYLGLGFDWPITDNIRLLTNAGYHLDTESGSKSSSGNNTGMSFTRFSLEAIPYFQVSESFKLGAGVVYHSSNKIVAKSLDNTSLWIKFDDTLGFTTFVGHQLKGSRTWFELRYTYLEYQAVEDSETAGKYIGPKFDGSHVGLMLHWALL